MNYATTARRPNPLAAIGALGVPASFGVLLVIGLAVTATVKDPDKGLEGFFMPAEPIDDPLPPPPDPVVRTTNQTNPVPQPDTARPSPAPVSGVTLTGTGPLATGGTLNDDWGTGLESIAIPPVPKPAPTFDPVAATPRGNPGNWIKTSDYRTPWIRRGYEGIARFTVEISASGKVTDCMVTGSSGYAQLDRATCQLIGARAVFNPAKDASGANVAGSYSSMVNWQIPE